LATVSLYQAPVPHGARLLVSPAPIFIFANRSARYFHIAIERLERAGIVGPVSDAKRDRVYCATALLEVLEEPARLEPAPPSGRFRRRK
jgi:hypothetical protein